MNPKKSSAAIAAVFLLGLVCSNAFSQVCYGPNCPQNTTQCIGGICYQVQSQPEVLQLQPLTQADQDDFDLTASHYSETRSEDRFERMTKATCRITVSGVCGSGTVVGRDSAGHALVLTNAHVAGTARGRVVNVERWNPDGSSERGNGAIIASGYARGLSVDFALLKCNAGFAADVTPIPLADRYPNTAAGVTTFGCPRCEWPSLQVLKITQGEGQVLHWKPEAIGGRSGSSVIDHTESGPRVVGLLTWGGGGEGLGQSTPFLLSAMRGQMPKSFEQLPPNAREVSAAIPEHVRIMPCSTDGQMLALLPTADETDGKTPDATIDDIVEDGPDAGPDAPDDDDGCGIFGRDRDRDPIVEPVRPFRNLFDFIRKALITIAIAVGAAAVGYGIGRLRS